MPQVFISGIPASGKSYLAEKIAKQFGILHIDLDKFRMKMSEDSKLKPWVDFFFNLDEERYWQSTSCEEHWENLVKQSEAFWPTIKNKIRETMKSNQSVIIEGVNVLPHLAKELNLSGIFLLGESFESIFERNKKAPRWGKTEKLQLKEAEIFFGCEGNHYKLEAEKYGFKTFQNSEDAEKELTELMTNSKIRSDL